MTKYKESLSENQLIAYIDSLVPKKNILLGIGDDAAVLPWQEKNVVTTTDTLVDGVHFRLAWADPYYLGQKVALVNISDMAAMGAVPTHALVSLILPRSYFNKRFIEGLYKGLHRSLDVARDDKDNISIVGGNISRGDTLSITVTLFGYAPYPVLTRSGAQSGDLLCVTGSLGIAAREIQELLSGEKKNAQVLPPNRLSFGQQLAKLQLATSCMDISDGLSLDLHRLCAASGVGAEVDMQSIPTAFTRSLLANVDLAISGGEDYELLFTVSEKNLNDVISLASSVHTPVCVIGHMQSKELGIALIDTQGNRSPFLPQGWDHGRL